MRFLIIVFLLTFSSVPADILKNTDNNAKGIVYIYITGFRNGEGAARVAMFNDEKGFPNDVEKACWKTITAIENGEILVQTKDVGYGTYAVSVFHDANNNGILDKKWHIIPDEGFGTSNNMRQKKEKPDIQRSIFCSQFRFNLCYY